MESSDTSGNPKQPALTENNQQIQSQKSKADNPNQNKKKTNCQTDGVSPSGGLEGARPSW
eukprot:11171713-Lingulodinium_polyedra.AAC.1